MDPTISLADQPLDFAPRFNRDNDLQMQPTFAHHDPAAMNNWVPPVVPGVGYPPIPPVLASGPQVLILTVNFVLFLLAWPFFGCADI